MTRVAGSASWGAREESFRRLAGRIERSGADAVFLGGYFFQNGARLIRDLRATLGRDVPLIGPDGFSEYRAVVAGAGAAAEGLVYSVAAFPPDRPPPSGRLFVASFGRAIGGEIDPYSATTAQATEVLLDAIAASDGSRASVTERLLEVRIEDGVLGSFGFDRNGDTTAPAVAMYRIEGGKPRVLEVLRPPRRLVR